MPADPEFRDVYREKRTDKVCRQPEAQHLRRTQSQVGITRKIRVGLEGKEDHSRQVHYTAVQIIGRISVDCIHEHRQPVCDDQLLEKSPQHHPQATLHPVKIKIMGNKDLRQQVL